MKPSSQRLAKTDPHKKREASRYSDPIASREYILQIITNHGVPTTFERLCERLRLSKPAQTDALRARLGAMVRDGQLLKNRKQGYMVVEESSLLAGAVFAHPDGYGFFIPDAGGGDLYLSGKQMRQVLHGDRVVVRAIGENRRGKQEGLIVEITARANSTVVGRFAQESGVAFVVPDNKRITQDILVAPEQQGGAQVGQIVVAEIVEQPSKRHPPVGHVTRVLGDHMMPGMEIEAALYSHGIPAFFPTDVKKAVKNIGEQVSAADKRNRTDLRDLPLITIDGEDARDFDDAVYCEQKAGGGWRLLVAIADVSHYVRPQTALDEEAAERATSVYFPGRVIPMLPEQLSNGLCSLNPDVDRLCMVCDMSISAAGEVTRSQFREAVMRSHARLTYTQVAAVLDGTDSSVAEGLHARIEALHGLYKALRKQREKRGAIDFDTVETRIVFSAEKKIDRIEPVYRNDAHKLIEECMILANICAARFLQRHRAPALYRVHAPPNEEKIVDLRAFLQQRSLRLSGGDNPEPLHFSRLASRAASRPDHHVVQGAILRTLSQALYLPQCEGHFGLALENYAHFTSPIRRYPDLLVHRAIRYILRNGKKADYGYDDKTMQRLGQHCSSCERRADEATRDVTNWLKCEYMLAHVGDAFSAVVSSVMPFGLFVELDDIYIEGLLHITSLPKDYYRHDAIAQTLTGERAGRRYAPGDRIRVEVLQVTLDERKIDLGLLEKTSKTTSKKTARKISKKDTGKKTKKPKQKNGKTRG